MSQSLKLYTTLAPWWPLMSAPADYEEEATFYGDQLMRTLGSHEDTPTLLELGSGGGNNASFLKSRFQMTLVDLSESMLAVSRALNPQCTHLQGDMRTVRLDEQFDAVFIQDAIAYILTEEDLLRVFETVWCHLKPGGAALLAPDDVTENFSPSTEHGGHDGVDRAFRYLSWTTLTSPTRAVTDFSYIIHQPNGEVQTAFERHEFGVFPRQFWLEGLRAQGFDVEVVPLEHTEVEDGAYEVFVLSKPKEVRQ